MVIDRGISRRLRGSNLAVRMFPEALTLVSIAHVTNAIPPGATVPDLSRQRPHHGFGLLNDVIFRETLPALICHRSKVLFFFNFHIESAVELASYCCISNRSCSCVSTCAIVYITVIGVAPIAVADVAIVDDAVLLLMQVMARKRHKGCFVAIVVSSTPHGHSFNNALLGVFPQILGSSHPGGASPGIFPLKVFYTSQGPSP